MRVGAVFLCGVLLTVVLLMGGLRSYNLPRSYDLLQKSTPFTPTRASHAKVRLTSPTTSIFSDKLPIQCQPVQVAHRRTHPEYPTNIAQLRISSFAHGKVPAGLSLTNSIVTSTNALCQVIHPTRAHTTKILEALKPSIAPTTSMQTPAPYSLPARLPICGGHYTCPLHSTKDCHGPHSDPIATARLTAASITLQHGGSFDNTLDAYLIPTPTHHSEPIPTHPQMPIQTSFPTSHGVNQSKAASIPKTANPHVYIAAERTPTSDIRKCPAVTPYDLLEAPPRVPMPTAALANAAPPVYPRIPDATTHRRLSTEGGYDGTVPGKTEVNATASVVGSFGDTTTCATNERPAMAGNSFSTSPTVSANSITDHALLPDCIPTCCCLLVFLLHAILFAHCFWSRPRTLEFRVRGEHSLRSGSMLLAVMLLCWSVPPPHLHGPVHSPLVTIHLADRHHRSGHGPSDTSWGSHRWTPTLKEGSRFLLSIPRAVFDISWSTLLSRATWSTLVYLYSFHRPVHTTVCLMLLSAATLGGVDAFLAGTTIATTTLLSYALLPHIRPRWAVAGHLVLACIIGYTVANLHTPEAVTTALPTSRPPTSLTPTHEWCAIPDVLANYEIPSLPAMSFWQLFTAQRLAHSVRITVLHLDPLLTWIGHNVTLPVSVFLGISYVHLCLQARLHPVRLVSYGFIFIRYLVQFGALYTWHHVSHTARHQLWLTIAGLRTFTAVLLFLGQLASYWSQYLGYTALNWSWIGAHSVLSAAYAATHWAGSHSSALFRKGPKFIRSVGWAMLCPCRWALFTLGKLKLRYATHQYILHLKDQPTVAGLFTDLRSSEIIRIGAMTDSELLEALAQFDPHIIHISDSNQVKALLLDAWQHSHDTQHGHLLDAPEQPPLESVINSLYQDSHHFEMMLQAEIEAHLDPRVSGGGKALTTDDIASHTVHGYESLHDYWLAHQEALLGEGILDVHPPCADVATFIAAVDTAYGTRLAGFCRHRDLGGTSDPTANKVKLYNWLAKFSRDLSFPLPPESAVEDRMAAYRDLVTGGEDLLAWPGGYEMEEDLALKHSDPLGSFMEVAARTQTLHLAKMIALKESEAEDVEHADPPPEVIAPRDIPVEDRQGLAFLYKAGFAPVGLHRHFMPYTLDGVDITVHDSLSKHFGAIYARHDVDGQQILWMVTGIAESSRPDTVLLEFTCLNDTSLRTVKSPHWANNTHGASSREEAYEMHRNYPSEIEWVAVQLEHDDGHPSGFNLDTLQTFECIPKLVTWHKPYTPANEAPAGSAPVVLHSHSTDRFRPDNLSHEQIQGLRELCEGSLKIQMLPKVVYPRFDPHELEDLSLIHASPVKGLTASEQAETYQSEHQQQSTSRGLGGQHSICVCCVSRDLASKPADRRTRDDIIEALDRNRPVDPREKFCTTCESRDGTRWRRHPPLLGLDHCSRCGLMVVPNGAVLSGCPHCPATYSRPEKDTTTSESTSWQPKTEHAMTKAEYAVFYYAAYFGGDAPHVLNAKTAPEFERTLGQRAATMDLTFTAYTCQITHRIIYFSARFRFGYPQTNANDRGAKVSGLSCRDFQPSDPLPLGLDVLEPKALKTKAHSAAVPKWPWEMPGMDSNKNPYPDRAKCTYILASLENLLAFVVWAYGVKYDADATAFLEAIKKLRGTPEKCILMNAYELEVHIDGALTEWTETIHEQVEDFRVDRRRAVERAAGHHGEGGNIRLLYSPQLKFLVLRRAAIERYKEKHARDAMYAEGHLPVRGKPLVSGSNALPPIAPTPPPIQPAAPPTIDPTAPPTTKWTAFYRCKKLGCVKPNHTAECVELTRSYAATRTPGCIKEPCQDFAKGKCIRGDTCWHLHVPGTPGCFDRPCAHAKNGKCKYGDKCWYKHSNSQVSAGGAPFTLTSPGPTLQLKMDFVANHSPYPAEWRRTRCQPLTLTNQPVCADYNSNVGCRLGSECSHAHVNWTRWPTAWCLYLFDRGGCKHWPPITSEELVHVPGYAYPNSDPWRDAKRLTHAWGEVMIPNTSPLFTGDIEDKKESFKCKLLYGQEPITLATRNLMLIRASYAVAFGSGTQVLQGICDDVGEITTRPDGSQAINTCLLRSYGANLAPKPMSPTAIDVPTAAMLEVEIYKELVAINPHQLDPHSRAATIFFTTAMSKRGYADHVLALVDPPTLKHHNILHLITYKGSLSAYYYPSSSNGYPSQPVAPRYIASADSYDKLAVQNEVIIVVTSECADLEGRHSMPMRTVERKLTHKVCVRMLADWHTSSAIHVEVCARGNWLANNSRPTDMNFTLRAELLMLAHAEVCKHYAHITGQPHTSGRLHPAGMDRLRQVKFADPPTPKISPKSDAHRRSLLEESILPTLASNAADTAEGHRAALTAYMDVCDEWLLAEYEAIPPSNVRRARLALLNMVSKFKTWFFGDWAGPYDDRSAEAFEILKETLDQDHYQRIMRDLKVGTSAMRAGRDVEYKADNHKSVDGAKLKILEDFVKQVVAKKALLFTAAKPQVMSVLLQGGVLLNPMGAVEKKWPTGHFQLDEAGNVKWRPIVDGTNAGHIAAPNQHSYTTSLPVQMTTTLTHMLRSVFRVEATYPTLPVRHLKYDVSDAFRILMWCLQDVGAYAHQYDGVVNVTLALVFGGSSCPSLWESHSKAAEVLVERKGVGEWPSPAQLARVVDDFWLVFALTTDCGADPCYDTLRQYVRTACGPNAINELKHSIAYSINNVFGTIIDTELRTAGTPWSKVLKMCEGAKTFVDRVKSTLSLKEVHSLSGLAQYVYKTKPQFLPIIQSRLSRCLSQASPIFSPALPYETASEGWTRLREGLHLTARLILRDRGSLLTVPFEEALPMSARLTFPSHESIDAIRSFSMDASGTGAFVMDMTSGDRVFVPFTDEEQTYFNKFGDENCTDIAMRELYAAFLGGCMLATKYDGAILCFGQDNSNVEAWINGASPPNRQTEQLIHVLMFASIVCNFRIRARRISTEDNVLADAGTRPDKQGLFHEKIKEWENEHSASSHEVQVPHYLRNLGWTGTQLDHDKGFNPLPICHALLEHWIANGAVPHRPTKLLELWKADLEAVMQGDPYPEVPTHDYDTLEEYGPSLGRLAAEPLNNSRNSFRSLVKKEWSKSTQKFHAELDKHEHALRQQPNDEARLAAFEWVTPELRRLDVKVAKHNDNPARLLACLRRVRDAEHDRLEAEVHRRAQLQLTAKWLALREGNRDHNPAAVLAMQRAMTQPTRSPCDGTPEVFEFCAGISTLGKAFQNAGIGKLVGFAENNFKLHDKMLRTFPSAKGVSDLSEITAELLTALKVKIYVGGAPCPNHSPASGHARGLATKEGRLYCTCVLPALDAYQGRGVEVILVECTNGVRENKGNAGVPLNELTKILQPKYAVSNFTIDTPRVRSPRTGMVSALHHSRTYVLGLRKDLEYAHRQHSPPGQGELLVESAAHLVRNIESHYMVMPIEDRRDLDIFKKKQGIGKLKGTMSAITKIREYSTPTTHKHRSNEMGSGGFPDTAYDLQSGLLPTYTAAGGSRWVYTNLNGLAVPRLLSTLEAAAAYGLEDGDLEMLSPDSEYGQSAIGNCIPQPVADALAQFIYDIRNGTDSATSGGSHNWIDSATAPHSSGGYDNHCKCGAKFELYTSRTASNPGRRFWHCPEWSDCRELLRGGNGYFKWATSGLKSPAPRRDEAVHTPRITCEQCLMHPLHCICPPQYHYNANAYHNPTAASPPEAHRYDDAIEAVSSDLRSPRLAVQLKDMLLREYDKAKTSFTSGKPSQPIREMAERVMKSLCRMAADLEDAQPTSSAISRPRNYAYYYHQHMADYDIAKTKSHVGWSWGMQQAAEAAIQALSLRMDHLAQPIARLSTPVQVDPAVAAALAESSDPETARTFSAFTRLPPATTSSAQTTGGHTQDGSGSRPDHSIPVAIPVTQIALDPTDRLTGGVTGDIVCRCTCSTHGQRTRRDGKCVGFEHDLVRCLCPRHDPVRICIKCGVDKTDLVLRIPQSFYPNEGPTYTLWCQDCFATLSYGETLLTDNQLVVRREDRSTCRLRQYCMRHLAYHAVQDTRRPLMAPVIANHAECEECTHLSLKKAAREAHQRVHNTDRLSTTPCAWCLQAVCRGCTPSCPACHQPCSNHTPHCRLTGPTAFPTVEPYLRNQLMRQSPLTRDRLPCNCVHHLTGLFDCDAEGAHTHSCPQRQERLFISSAGPALILIPHEPRGYLEAFGQMRNVVTEVLDRVDEVGKPALVPRKFWLKKTEGWFHQDLAEPIYLSSYAPDHANLPPTLPQAVNFVGTAGIGLYKSEREAIRTHSEQGISKSTHRSSLYR